jgi:hypothetical protein
MAAQHNPRHRPKAGTAIPTKMLCARLPVVLLERLDARLVELAGELDRTKATALALEMWLDAEGGR